MSGDGVTFVGDAMSSVVQGIAEVGALTGQAPVVVGGLAVLSRLSTPYRATVDLDLVDRMLGDVPHLQLLRACAGAEPVQPAAVLLPTRFGQVKVDVLQVRQVELDHPSDDPGDRLHASSHAWANDTATGLTIRVVRRDGETVEVTTLVAEPGPLIAMKLQAVMDRSAQKQGTDLLDIMRLTFDRETRPAALTQIGDVSQGIADDIAEHVAFWLQDRRQEAVRLMHRVGGQDVTLDDLDLAAELLHAAARR